MNARNARGQVLNTLLSALWTVMLLGPVYWFCARHLSITTIVLLLALALALMCLPRSTMRRLALSAEPAVYRRLHVPLLIRLTQDAGWLRRWSGSPQQRARRELHALAVIARDSWMRERFHLGLFVFCLLCAGAACLQGSLLWCAALLLIDVAYNLYPMWLQQYLRLRVDRCQRRLRPK